MKQFKGSIQLQKYYSRMNGRITPVSFATSRSMRVWNKLNSTIDHYRYSLSRCVWILQENNQFLNF